MKTLFEGFWWVPSHHNNKIYGKLKSSKHGLLILKLFSSNSDIYKIPLSKEVSAILGHLTSGETVTCFDCQSLGDVEEKSHREIPGKPETGSRLIVDRFQIGGIIKGDTFTNPYDLKILGIGIRSKALNRWVQPNNFTIENSENPHELIVQYKKPKIFALHLENGSKLIIESQPKTDKPSVFGIKHLKNLRESPYITSVKEDTFALVEFSKPYSLDQIWWEAKKLKTFLDFFANLFNSNPKYFLYLEDERTGLPCFQDLIYPGRNVEIKEMAFPDENTLLSDYDVEELERAFEKWFELWDEVPLALSHFLKTKEKGNLRNRDDYLHLIRSLEASYKYIFEGNRNKQNDGLKKKLDYLFEELEPVDPIILELGKTFSKSMVICREEIAHANKLPELEHYDREEFFIFYQILEMLSRMTIFKLLGLNNETLQMIFNKKYNPSRQFYKQVIDESRNKAGLKT